MNHLKSPKNHLIINVQLLLFFTLFFFSSCNKKPEADFKMDTSTYSAGDQLKITNLSINATSQTWDIKNSLGSVALTNEEKNPNLIIPILSADDTYRVDLTVYNKRKRHSSTLTKTFEVKTIRGSISVKYYDYYSWVDKFDVYVDDQFVGSATSGEYTSDQLPIGLRLITVKAPNSMVQSKTVNITAGNLSDVYFN